MKSRIPALLLTLAAVALNATELGVDSSHFVVNGKRTFLLGMSYYGALGAPSDFITKDLDDLQRDGFNWIRVWATWAAFGNDVSAVGKDGTAREPYLTRLEDLVKDCDRRGLIVDVTLARQNGVTGGPRLQTFEAHQRAVRVLLERLRQYRNWYLDLGNERNIEDKRFVPYEDLGKLRALAREIDPKRLVTASHSSDDSAFLKEIDEYVKTVRVDFLANHRPRSASSAEASRPATESYRKKLKDIGLDLPIHFQEPFRHGFTEGWEPTPENFLSDLRGAIEGGAAGWCLHNGAEVGPENGEPRRSFDLRKKRLYDQLDAVELETIRKIKSARLGELAR